MEICFNININGIREEERQLISKDKSPKQTYFQKELSFRKEEKTTTNFEFLSFKYDSIAEGLNIKEKQKQKDIQKLFDSFNKEEEKLEKNGKYSYVEPERSISTACCSIMSNSELVSSYNYEFKKDKIPKIYIDINSIKFEDDQRINEEMKKINDPYLNEYQKRKKVLENDITLTDNLKNKRFEINIEKIKKENENILNYKSNLFDMNYPNNFQKRVKIIKDEKTTTDIKNNEIFYNYNNDSFNDYNSFSQEESTKMDSKTDISENKSLTYEIEQIKKAGKKFNAAKQKFYIKNKLYDLPLYEEKDKEKIKLIPEICQIDDDSYGFLYSNDRTTYFITKSGYIGDKKSFITLSEKDTENCNYQENLGLHFCGKEIILENEKTKKRCCPNEFICKSCMDINKKRYNIKNNYLINIKGRVAKVNKGSYHCFGHFLCGNQIEDCISKFSCEACRLLDLYSSYYQ